MIPVTIDPGEELLARVGVAHSIMRSTTPIHVYKKTLPIGDDIEAAVKAFMATKGAQVSTVRPPKIEYDAVLKALADNGPPESNGWKYVPGDLVGPYTVAIARAKQYLNQVFPRMAITDLVSTRNLPPSSLQLNKFRRVWGVGEDPLVALKALREGTLVTDQAVALQVMFPTIFQFIQAALFDEISQYRVGDPNRVFPYAKDQALQTLLLKNPGDPGEFAALQKNFADAKDAKGEQSAQASDQKAPPPSRLAKAVETPIQRASQ